MSVVSLRKAGLYGSKFNRMSSVSPSYDVTVLNWHNLYWASGTEFSSLNLGDGDPVTTWPDEINGNNLSCSLTNYVTSDANFNYRPIVRLGNALQQSVMSTACSAVVVIFRMSVVTSTDRWHDNQGAGGGGRWVMGTYLGNWQLYFGGTASQNVSATGGPHSALYYQDGSNDRLEIDGSTIYGPTNAGTSTMSRLNIVDVGSDVDIALLGTYDGDPTADPGWISFQLGVYNLYGLTV